MVFSHFQIAVVRSRVKKGNLSILSRRIPKGSEKSKLGVFSVYTMRHCFQGPCQGPLHTPSKGNVILYDQMILLVMVHSIACWDDGHMTN